MYVDQIYDGRCAVTDWILCPPNGRFNDPTVKGERIRLLVLDTSVCKNYRRNFIFRCTLKHDFSIFFIIKFEGINVFNLWNFFQHLKSTKFYCYLYWLDRKVVLSVLKKLFVEWCNLFWQRKIVLSINGKELLLLKFFFWKR